MALIECPECNKDMSDTINACPHCGYRRDASNNDLRESVIGKPEINWVGGIGCFILTYLVYYMHSRYDLVGSITTLWSLSSLWAVSSLLGGILFFGIGIAFFLGKSEVKCPYCYTDDYIRRFEKTFKCKCCNNISIRMGSILRATR